TRGRLTCALHAVAAAAAGALRARLPGLSAGGGVADARVIEARALAAVAVFGARPAVGGARRRAVIDLAVRLVAALELAVFRAALAVVLTLLAVARAGGGRLVLRCAAREGK